METIIILAFALAADAFAVSVGAGCNPKRLQPITAMKMALLFGLFQGAMPLIGLGMHSFISDSLQSLERWIAFCILILVGFKMIYDAKFGEDAHHRPCYDDRTLILLALATSLDALAVGFTFPLITETPYVAALLIGVITFGLSLFGIYLGLKIGCWMEKGAEYLGGIILVLIGLKIVI